jgi:hypothetical protein
MPNQQKEEIFQFLAGNWYSRPENDSEIIEEIVETIGRDKIHQHIILIRHYLASSESPADKDTFIRQSVQRYIPEEVNAPLVWLNEIIQYLEQSLEQKKDR